MNIEIDKYSDMTEEEAAAIINQKLTRIVAEESVITLYFENGMQIEISSSYAADGMLSVYVENGK